MRLTDQVKDVHQRDRKKAYAVDLRQVAPCARSTLKRVEQGAHDDGELRELLEVVYGGDPDGRLGGEHSLCTLPI